MFAGKFLHGYLYQDITGAIYRYVGTQLESKNKQEPKLHIVKFENCDYSDIVSEIALRKNTEKLYSDGKTRLSDYKTLKDLQLDKEELVKVLEFIFETTSRHNSEFIKASTITRMVELALQQLEIRNRP